MDILKKNLNSKLNFGKILQDLQKKFFSNVFFDPHFFQNLIVNLYHLPPETPRFIRFPTNIPPINSALPEGAKQLIPPHIGGVWGAPTDPPPPGGTTLSDIQEDFIAIIVYPKNQQLETPKNGILTFFWTMICINRLEKLSTK